MSRTRSFVIPSIMLLATAGAVPAAAQQRVEVVTRRTPAPADSASPIRRLQRQLDSLAQRYNEGEELTLGDRRRMEVEISRIVNMLVGEGAKSRLMLRQMQPDAFMSAAPIMPKGWIGIVAEGAGMEPRVEHGDLVVRYLSYPRIVSVDPSSPAQAAGIVPNDTLIAYDGRDVRDNDINLNRLLVPLAKVSVRLRHDGRVREVPVTIGEAPSRVAQRRSDEVNDGRTIVISPSPDGPFPQRIPMPVPGGARGATTFTFVVQGVAGAQLATVSADLRKSLKLSEGVLVTSAPVGSPAAMSGLKDGDVLVKVGDSQVRTVNDVRRAVGFASENGQRAIDVVLVRDKATLTKTLRW